MGFEHTRQRYIASHKPNALPTELSGRPLHQIFHKLAYLKFHQSSSVFMGWETGHKSNTNRFTSSLGKLLSVEYIERGFRILAHFKTEFGTWDKILKDRFLNYSNSFWLHVAKP